MLKIGYIGIDVGGTKTRLCLFDKKFTVLEDIKLKTTAFHSAESFTRALKQSLNVLMKKGLARRLEIENVGVGCAGTFNPDGSIKISLNIPFLRGYSFRSVIAKHTGANVIVTNDVAAGLYGEHQLGAAAGYKHAIGIFIGTGIGGAILLDGKIHRGPNGSAGDIGHYMLNVPNGSTRTRRRVLLNDIASRTAIAAAAAELAACNQAPYLRRCAGKDSRHITAGTLAAAIEHGDTSVKELVRGRCYMLGVALSNFVDFLNPEIIVLGGGLADRLPVIVRSAVEAGIRENSKCEPQADLKVATTKLKGHAVAAGAAKLSADTALSLIAA
ncbi:MAG TPA: ROK family protein [Terriglobia bacterium]